MTKDYLVYGTIMERSGELVANMPSLILGAGSNKNLDSVINYEI